MFTNARFVRILQVCVLIGVLVGSGWMVNQSMSAATEEVPQFKFDPSYPKPLGHGWILGAIGALWVDSKDHVWIAQRPGSVNNPGDRFGFQKLSECCSPAPPVMEFDPAGNLLQAFGPLHEQDGKLLPGQ